MMPKITYCFTCLQLLDTGFFHADPHPGNLIRTPDGKLAILDFGNKPTSLEYIMKSHLSMALYAYSHLSCLSKTRLSIPDLIVLLFKILLEWGYSSLVKCKNKQKTKVQKQTKNKKRTTHCLPQRAIVSLFSLFSVIILHLNIISICK